MTSDQELCTNKGVNKDYLRQNARLALLPRFSKVIEILVQERSVEQGMLVGQAWQLSKMAIGSKCRVQSSY